MRYTSPISLFGLPLVEVVLPGPVPPGSAPERPIACGWLAVGPIAIGVVSFGGLALGGLALGGLAIGGIALGGLAIGAIALGGGAIGWCSVGGAALAIQAALGGLAVASQFALGGAAFAQHANDQVAREFFGSGFVFPLLQNILRHSRWFLLLLALPLFFRPSTKGNPGP